MLRKFYLIILLLCIEWTFSYNHIIEETPGRKYHKFGRFGKRTRKIGKNRIKKNLIHEKYNYIRSPVDFDVASFIQPDDELIEEEAAFRHPEKKRRRLSNNYDYDSLVDTDMSDGNKRKDKGPGPEYLSFGTDNIRDKNSNNHRGDTKAKHNIALGSFDELNAKYQLEKSKIKPKDDSLVPIQNPLHNPTKKCAFSHIKIPFFSHKKPKLVSSKKPKKRKVFCFDCLKKDDEQHANANRSGADHLLQYKNKRSPDKKQYAINKKKTVETDNLPYIRRKKAPSRIDRISKQFYKKYPSQTKINDDLRKSKNFDFGYLDGVIDEANRERREETSPERIRQLKELEEVQKKIDNVQVVVPQFGKLPNLTN